MIESFRETGEIGMASHEKKQNLACSSEPDREVGSFNNCLLGESDTQLDGFFKSTQLLLLHDLLM